MVLRPFIVSILAGIIIAYIFFPVYKFVQKRLKSKNLSAFLVSILIILLIASPFVLVVNTIYSDANFAYVRVKQKLSTGDLLGLECKDGVTSFPCKIQHRIEDFLGDEQMRYYIQDTVERVTGWLVGWTSDFIISLPGLILSVFVAFFTSFYLFKDGKKLFEWLKPLLPFNKRNQRKLFLKMNETMHAVLYGTLIIAVIQGTLGAIGFYLVGIPSFLLWGMLMTMFSLIPMVGTPIIWAPASIILTLVGYTNGDTVMMVKGICLFFYGLFVISTIDNILKPKLIGDRSSIHPVFILVGVLGGLQFLGFIGFIIGPMIFALFATFLEIYEEEKGYI